MGVLTRMPRELRSRLAAVDPARDIDIADRPDLDELIARAERETTIERTPLRRLPRLRVLAPAAAVAAIAIAATGLVVFRTGHDAATTGPSRPVAAAAFPVDATPRPVVPVGDTVVTGGFPSGDTKLAFDAGAIDLATELPNTPAVRDGYPVMSARSAVTQLTDVHTCCARTLTRLKIVAITLADHLFDTDRGSRLLPAWRVEFAGVPEATYVLAVATSARYPHRLSGFAAGADDVTVSADGRSLTVWLRTAYRASTGPCDLTYRQTLSVGQRPNAVQLSIDTIFERAPAPATGHTYSPMACDNIGHLPHPPRAPEKGEPNTRTIALDHPLGNRIVVDDKGRPYVVTAG